jgi:glucosamine--fructose-6-phosphate aminotransferase (isomerizing)
MCGIIGVVGSGDVIEKVVEGLKRLEYRGYDSAGIATLVKGRIERRRAEGRIANLEKLLRHAPIQGAIAIGHTRWATHGCPSENNAHPHVTDKVAVVHNGIIENFMELRAELKAKGHVFSSDTDTETIAHLLTSLLDGGYEPEQAVAQAMTHLQGAFSLGVVFADRPGLMAGARRGSPLAVGYGDDEMFLGSDAIALAPLTNRISYLEENDYVMITRDGATIYNHGRRVDRPVGNAGSSQATASKGNYRHFMMKEIAEQPAVIGNTLRAYINPLTLHISLPPLPIDLRVLSRLTIVGCGTAFLAGHVAKYWFEQVAQLPVELDIASEFRYRAAPLDPGGATIAISQSGETADTLAAVRYARAKEHKILAILNVAASSIGREADAVLQTLAGPEIGVASTKAFTTQLVVLAVLSVAAARARGAIDAKREEKLIGALLEVPALVAEVLDRDAELKSIALRIAEARDVLFIGRGTSYSIAMEGALKLKEISYIHAEGYAAGEMKHGPIALIDDGVPVIVVAPSDSLFDKTASNLQEVRARGGQVIFLSDADGIKKLGTEAIAAVELPKVDPFVAPLVYAIAVQLLAYHAAVARGADVDKPRNLAKSVTVE